MRFAVLYPSGLKANALLISVTLMALTGILGIRAHTVARVHIEESRSLLERDIPLQSLLFQLEAALSAKLQARKKWDITEDAAYEELFTKYQALESRIQAEIEAVKPGLIDTQASPSGLTNETIQKAHKTLIAEKEESLRQAHEVAARLRRVMSVAMIVSLVITAWLVVLLYRGLLRPLGRLRDATARIREGQLSCRMTEKGVSELREIAQAFNLMAARLESLDKAKNEFLATISHEIRNPMTALKEGLALISSEEKRLTPESRKRCLSACLIASKRLEFMINNLLNLSRTGAGILEREFAQRNIAQAAQTAIDEVRPLAEKKNIQIRLSAPESVPMSFHWEGVVQALVNLLLNAIKYGNDASTVEVQIHSVQASQSAEIEITNSGAEIAAAELSRIFDRFYRGANSSKQQGMGVGLHVVKKVVEAHQGAVSAVSGAGKTRMKISLPKHQPRLGVVEGVI